MGYTFEQIFNSLEGWCTLQKAQTLHNLVLRTKDIFPNDKLISVELGIFGGKSLIPLALAHKEIGNGYAFGIDSFDNETPLEGENSDANNKYWKELDMDAVFGKFLLAVERYKLRSYCRFVQERTDFGARLFDDNSITLLHEDGNHNLTSITRELNLWIPKLKIGGFWIADDTDWSETQDAYSKLPDYGLNLVEDYQKWQVWQKVS